MTGMFQPGQTLGRYKILRTLGSGAMGDVYLAEDPQIERKLALKTVRVADGRPSEVEERKRRLLREAKAAGRVVHPNATTLFDAGEADGVLYLAFEFVDGADLAKRMEQAPPLTLGQVLRIIREAADALDAAHQHGIVHRDIKPSNILLDRNGRVKVADFGIARMAGQATELTMTGSVVGSPHYLSPEQVRGDELDGRTDVFSLGVVLYELLCRRRPFDGETLTTLVYQILHKEAAPIPDLRPGLNPRVDELLRRMLVKDRDLRFRTAAEVSDEVRRIERELAPELLAAPAMVSQEDGDATHVMSKGSLTPIPPSPPSRSQPIEPPTAIVASAPTEVRALPIPPPPPPAPVAPAPARAGTSSNLWIILAVVGLLGLGGVGGVGYWLWSKRAALTQPAAPASSTTTVADSPSPTKDPGVRVEPTRPGPTAPTDPTANPATTPTTTPTTAPVRPTRVEPAPVRPPATPTRPIPSTPDPVPTRPAPADPEPSRPPVADDEPRAPIANLRFDRELDTGTALLFEIQPDDAFLLLKEVGESRSSSIGRASEYKSGKDSRPYRLPDSGDFLLTIRKDGADDVVLLLHADGGRGTTKVRHNFAARAGSAAIRVKQGVTLKGSPDTARVSVDGSYRGVARDFEGRKFLELQPGLHRITIEVPGKGSEDFEVQVAPNAPKDRETLRFDIRG